MLKFSEQTIKTIQSLRKKGNSYKMIAKTLQLSPASIHKYSKHTSLTSKARKILKEKEKRKQITFASRYAKEKPILTPNLDYNFSSLLGHLFFDGSVSACDGKYTLEYTNSSLGAINAFSYKMKRCFGLKTTKIYKGEGKNIDWYAVQIHSKKAYKYLLDISYSFSTSKNIGVPKIIFDSTPELKSAFLRAFWDDEGCISNKSFGIICGIEKINQKKRNPCFRLIIRRSKENWQNFIENVGFEHGIITKGHNIGKHKKEILLEKFRRRYN